MFKTKAVRELTKFEQRMKILAIPDLRSWAERTIYDIGHSLSEYDRRRGLDDLEFAVIEAEHLHMLLQEMYNRLDT